ncbi:MAG: protein kinase [Terriglobia bacterium]
MPLSPGAQLGHYHIAEKIGAGGMGEVYRAHDTKLARDVALKVLPEAFAHDAERMARFEREARLLASLNHPHIAAIYGLEESGGTRFLVLELVAGPTLAERLTSGFLAIEEALGTCRQIAEALEAAHEKGIIHRDLKPGNVKVTPAGMVKVLDFGLAKAFAGEAAADISHSPTLSEVATRAGVILGTAAYMSPEQARGKPLDKRTDVWAFGCLLYETLTARQAFSGETISDTIAAILKSEPEWRALPANTPPNIQLLLRRCLQKDPNRRLHDIADARIEIDEALTAPATPSPAAATPTIARPRPPLWRRAIPLQLAALIAVLTAIAAGLAIWSLTRPIPPAPRPLTRFAISLPAIDRLGANGPGRVVVISPDATRIVYSGIQGGGSQLYLRQMDQLDPRPIPGTEGALAPFFSPDSQWVGFFADRKLKKVSVAGGVPLTLCDTGTDPRGATWASNDTIVFAPRGSSGLSRVPAGGGTPQVLTKLNTERGEAAHRWPEFLPGGQAVLFTVMGDRGFEVALVSLETGPDASGRRILIQGGTYAHYAPTGLPRRSAAQTPRFLRGAKSRGHLIYAQPPQVAPAGALLAVPFDLARLEVTGSPAPILEGVAVYGGGASQYSFSRDGALVYAQRAASTANRRLLWVDRQGKSEPLTEEPRSFWMPRLSPDGKRLALNLYGAPRWDVWVYELARGTLTRLTFEGENFPPVWTPDGQRVTFRSTRAGQRNLFWKPADGSGAAERLTTSKHEQDPTSWSPDGKLLAFAENNPETGWDIWVLPLKGEGLPRSERGKPQPFLQTPFNEGAAMFSPDGRWIAYTSDESGRYEVYVRPYPGPGGKRQISTAGGVWPVWARNGRELFYRNGDQMMAVAIDSRSGFTAGKPSVLFEGEYLAASRWGRNYDVAPDGQRFVMIQEAEQETGPPELYVVLNWFEELRRRAPPKN